MTLWPLGTSCAKEDKGHLLVQTSFTEPPNRPISNEQSTDITAPWTDSQPNSDHWTHTQIKEKETEKVAVVIGFNVLSITQGHLGQSNSCHKQITERGGVGGGGGGEQEDRQGVTHGGKKAIMVWQHWALTIHLHQQLVQRILLLTLPPKVATTSLTSHGIDLVHK